jgi:hypothetical protein
MSYASFYMTVLFGNIPLALEFANINTLVLSHLQINASTIHG